ncbi:tyrosine-protein phosphatase 4-like [Cloeon dipterum]|uniref:tyrosine-protein phosphatase 4-like n=1 Tax=Cloeon dipterum TaxID=197152 RepID=UPI00321FC340
MELKLNDSSSKAFCVDVVYLSDKKIHGTATLFSLELKDKRGTSKYKESVASKDSFEWTTARFRSGNISLEKGSTLTLNAHVESLVIGGVKFCKDGDLIFEPIVKKPKSCHALARKAKFSKPDEIDGIYKNRLLLLIECKSFNENCSGLKLCKNQSDNCTCFAGFEGENCTNPCESMKFGINCVNTTLKHCFGNKINQSDGNCLEGCAEGYIFPDCEKECSGNNYGVNCSEISTRACLSGNHSHIDGICLEGCVDGFIGPQCFEECSYKQFGKNCSEISDRSCSNDKHFSNNGSCQFGCAQGYVYPECLKEIQKAIPSYKTISFDRIILDLATSLEGKENISHIFIQYKENSEDQWMNSSDGYIFNDQAEYLVTSLKPKTDYNVRLALFENDTMDYPENFLPGDELNFTTECRLIDESSLNVKNVNMKTYSVSLNFSDDAQKGELCSPQMLTVYHDELGRIFNETLDGIDFQKSIIDCKCGENKIELTFKNAILYQNYACENCPKNAENYHNIYIPVLTTIIILIVITATGVGVYFIKRKRSHSPNRVQFSSHVEIIASAEMVPLSIIDQNDESSEKSDQDVEKYLLSSLASNVLKEQFEKFPRGQTQSWVCGVKPENKKKNRYGNLAAYDSSRVKLELLPGDENSDYINANYIDGFERPKAYIATQGPRVNTLDDFWRMVWQEKVPLIVMVTNLLEGGKNKCEKFWPDNNQEVTHGRITVRTVDKEVNADYVSRVLYVSCNNTNRLVQHLHYTVWPDHGVPLYPQSMAVFVEKIAEKNYAHPILVHCSAGVGRTGTMILIDACLRMIRTHGRLDVENIFATMRSQRANLVDNLKQFEFAHLVLLECVANPNFEISCANFTEEYNKLTSNDNGKLKESYSKLSKMCERDFQRTETPAKNEANKCRYPNFISSSNSIVQLFPFENVVTMSFVNAVTVDGYKKAKQFIATQAPMENTVADFWRMVDQFNVSEIVVLNEPHITEAQYLPTKQQKFVFGEIEVILDDVQEYRSVKTSDVTLKKKGVIKKLSVKCASFGWMPGDLSPPNMVSLIDLWDNLKIAGEKEYIAIVCHDGVTASGLFLGMGFVIEKIKLEQKVDVGLAVRTLKKSRPAFVSSEIQFGLLYEAAKHYLCSFDTYGNFK